MADQNLEIIARVQDLMTGPLKSILAEVGKVSQGIEESNRKTQNLEASQTAVSQAILETTQALLGEYQAQRKAREETEKANKATKQAAVDQRELAGAAGDVARNLGLNIGPLQAIATAAGPLAATVAAVVGLSEALGAVIEKSKQIDQALKPALGRVGAGALQGFREDLLRLSSETNVAAEEIAGGLASIFQNTTVRTRDAVRELLQQATLLSKVGFGPVANAVQALDGVLGAFQLRVQETSKVTAILATSAERAGVPIDQFATALQAAGPLARQFGLGLQDVAALIVSIKNQGVGLNDATRAIGGLLQIFSEEGNSTRKALEGIGVNFKTATKDGAGFADILRQIAERTKDQPELLAQLFPGGARTLQGVFAAVQGSAAEFRAELDRTRNAAKQFEEQVKNTTENATGYFQRYFNEVSNASTSFWNQFTDDVAIGLAGFTGRLDLAEGELKRAAARLGKDVDFRTSPVIEKLGADYAQSFKDALERQDVQAALGLTVDFENAKKKIAEQVKQLSRDIAAEVQKPVFNQAIGAYLEQQGSSITSEQLEKSPLFKSLGIDKASSGIIADRINAVVTSVKDQLSQALQKTSLPQSTQQELIGRAVETTLLNQIKGLAGFTGSIGDAVAEANKQIQSLGLTIEGQSVSFAKEGDTIKAVFSDIARASKESSESQARSSDAVLLSLALYAAELGKSATAAQNAQTIFEGTLSAKDREALALDRQIESIRALIAAYSSEGQSIDLLTRALDSLIAKRAELARAPGAFKSEAVVGESDLTKFFAKAAGLGAKAAQLTVQAQAKLKLDAKAFDAEQTGLLQDAQKLADERAAAQQDIIRLAYTPAIAIQKEGIERLVAQALAPLAEQLREIDSAFQAGEISVEQYNQQISALRDSAVEIRQYFESQVSFSDSFSASISDLADELGNTQKQAQSFAQDLTAGLTNAFSSLFNNIAQGKASLKDFGVVILQVIQQAISQLLALKAASAFLNIFSAGGGGAAAGSVAGTVQIPAAGAARGGIIPGRMERAQTLGNEQASHWRQIGSALKAGAPVRSYAMGGVASRPQVAVFGEGGGAEAFVPLPGPNRGIPVEFKRGQRPSQESGTTIEQSVNLTLNVGSLDPRTAADVVLAQMPQIQAAITQAISAGRDRALLGAVRGAVR